MVSRILAIAICGLSMSLPRAWSVEYMETGPNARYAAAIGPGGPAIVGYQSVTSGLVTIYRPVYNSGPACVTAGMANPSALPVPSQLSNGSAVIYPQPYAAYRLMINPLNVLPSAGPHPIGTAQITYRPVSSE